MNSQAQKGNSYPNPTRYLLLLDETGIESIKSLEKEFNMQFVSSHLLNSKKRGFQTLSRSEGLLFENLSIAVVEGIELEQLAFAAKSTKIKFSYFEQDRTFKTCSELSLIDEVQDFLQQAHNRLEKLEAIIKAGGTNKEPRPEWGVNAIGLNQNMRLSGRGIDICILDTGFASSHPDFVGRNIEGRSFVANEAWNDDQNGHGTHCVGVAAGHLSDTNRRYGVAHGANIRVGKVLSNSGFGSTSAILDAIDWAISQKYRVISMSLGSPVQLGEAPSRLFEIAGKTALKNNCLLIAAAGNDSTRPNSVAPVSSPANANSILAVAALDPSLKVASFSNAGVNASTGGEINVIAPGVNIFSSFPSPRYRSLNGTSMATPFVAGLAALYMEAFPGKSAKEIWKLLETTSKSLDGQLTRDIGKGLIQLKPS